MSETFCPKPPRELSEALSEALGLKLFASLAQAESLCCSSWKPLSLKAEVSLTRFGTFFWFKTTTPLVKSQTYLVQIGSLFGSSRKPLWLKLEASLAQVGSFFWLKSKASQQPAVSSRQHVAGRTQQAAHSRQQAV